MGKDEFHLADEQATDHLGRALARAFGSRPAGLVVLEGELGAGKSHLVRAWLRALGVQGAIRSPTYTLVEPYLFGEGGRALHLDLYRLSAPDELLALGLDDEPPDQVLWLIEWPSRAEGALPPPRLTVELVVEGDGRRARLIWGNPEDSARIDVTEDFKNNS